MNNILIYPITVGSITLIFRGLLIALSASSFLGIWFGIELNILGFLILIFTTEKSKSQRIVEYFVLQAFSRMMLVAGVTLTSRGILRPISQPIIIISLVIKAGLPPGHLWFITLFKQLSRFNVLFLRTIQKLIPFFLLRKMEFDYWVKLILVGTVIIRIIVLRVGRFIRVLAYSSVFRGAWCAVVTIKIELVFLFIRVYFLNLIVVLKGLNVDHLRQIGLGIQQLVLKVICLVGILSLSGFPPFSGFFTKIYLLGHIVVRGKLVEIVVLTIIGPMFFYRYLVFSVNFFKGRQPQRLLTPLIPLLWVYIRLRVILVLIPVILI